MKAQGLAVPKRAPNYQANAVSLDRRTLSLASCPNARLKEDTGLNTESVHQHNLIMSPLNKEYCPPQGPHDKGRSKKVTRALDLFHVLGQLKAISKEKNQYLHQKLPFWIRSTKKHERLKPN